MQLLNQSFNTDASCRLEDRILGLTQQTVDLKNKYDNLLRSKALCETERNQLRRKYQELRLLLVPTLSMERLATPVDDELIKASFFI